MVRQLNPTTSKPATQNELRRAVNSVEVLIQQFEIIKTKIADIEISLTEAAGVKTPVVEPKDFTKDIAAITAHTSEAKALVTNLDKKLTALDKRTKVLEDKKTDKLEARIAALEAQLKDLNK
jgi:chaperonin cofactor prefoldin